MTIEEVCKEFNISDIGDFSDGYHTFNELYHQRAVLFATIVNQNKDIAWDVINEIELLLKERK